MPYLPAHTFPRAVTWVCKLQLYRASLRHHAVDSAPSQNSSRFNPYAPPTVAKTLREIKTMAHNTIIRQEGMTQSSLRPAIHCAIPLISQSLSLVIFLEFLKKVKPKSSKMEMVSYCTQMELSFCIYMSKHWCWECKHWSWLRIAPKKITRGSFKVTHALLECSVAHNDASRPQRNQKSDIFLSNLIFMGI